MSECRAGSFQAMAKRSNMPAERYPMGGRDFSNSDAEDLTPSEAYPIYRKRDSVEKLIGSLENQVDPEPPRAWSDHSVEGALLLCFLARTMVSIAGYEVPEIRSRSTKFIISSLQNLTVTHIYDKKQAMRHVYSNFEHLNPRILRDTVIVSGVCGG